MVENTQLDLSAEDVKGFTGWAEPMIDDYLSKGEDSSDLVDQVNANTEDIADNAINIAQNASDIADNATNIATNTTDIAANVLDIENLYELTTENQKLRALLNAQAREIANLTELVADNA